MVQACGREFKSRPRHKVVGKNPSSAICEARQKYVHCLGSSKKSKLFAEKRAYLEMLVSVGLLGEQDSLLDENFSFGELSPDDAGFAGLPKDVDDDPGRQAVVQKLEFTKTKLVIS